MLLDCSHSLGVPLCFTVPFSSAFPQWVLHVASHWNLDSLLTLHRADRSCEETVVSALSGPQNIHHPSLDNIWVKADGQVVLKNNICLYPIFLIWEYGTVKTFPIYTTFVRNKKIFKLCFLVWDHYSRVYSSIYTYIKCILHSLMAHDEISPTVQ